MAAKRKGFDETSEVLLIKLLLRRSLNNHVVCWWPW